MIMQRRFNGVVNQGAFIIYEENIFSRGDLLDLNIVLADAHLI